MTIVEIKRENDRITKVKASGHADFACEGEDIVCAGISSIIQTAILGVKNILKVDILKERNEDTCTMEIVVPSEIDEKKDKDIQIILETMMCGLNDLCESYPNNISIKEI